jgi:hypothetical protein
MSSFSLRQNGDKTDEYYTPKSAWLSIADYIPKNKKIWEAFYGDGKSAEYLREMEHFVISADVDFFKNDFGEIIVSNPPYSIKKKVFERLEILDKPFILIVPVSTITKLYYRKYFADNCGIIIPKTRIHFLKNGDETKRCWFDTIFICYNIDGIKAREIIYL